jgi:predicted outer membrane repeat protein
LTIRNSDFIQNSAFGDGGAIFAIPPGKLTVTNSGFLENNSSFSDGGGIAAETAFSFLNLTLVANHAGENGGGILARGNGKIGSLTIDGNTSSGDGGGISIGSGAVKITNTIIGENAASGSGPDCSGSFSSQGFNLISNVSGCSISGQTSTNIVGQNPELGMAEPFDGLTIQEPLMGSPVLGAGGHCPKTDEIMHTRPHTGCDIGALELP